MADPRWLTPDERQTWLSFVLATGEVLDAVDRQLRADSGITRSQFSILQVVAMAPGGAVRITEVAARLRFSPSRLSHAVARLEKEGWLERRGDPDDGRAQLVALTAEGQRRIDEAAPRHVAEVRARLFDHLGPEQVVQLRAISDALLGAPSPEDDDPERSAPSSP